MKKDSKVIGIAVLAAATVLAFGAVYGAKYLTNKGSEVPAISLQADESIGVMSVDQLTDSEGNTTGYAVVVKKAGFGGDIEMKVSFASDAKTISGLEILSQTETDGLGSKITETEYLSQFEGMVAPVYIEGVAVASRAIAAEAKSAVLTDGVYTATGETASNGYTPTVTLTVEDGKIVAVSWDEENENGELKSVLSENGSYTMTEDGPTWAEQSKSLSQFVVDNQGTGAINMDENTKTDSVAGVSISVGGFVSLTNDCINQAKSTGYVDGVYTVEADEADNGYTYFITVTITDGKIADVVWDAKNEAGELKSVLSENGQYVMTENGPTWAAQSEALAASLIENQSFDGISLGDNGKTDSVAGVSISVNGFIDLADRALALAKTGASSEVTEDSKEEEPVIEEVPATETAGTKMDAISGATISSTAVMNGINTAYDYLNSIINE